MKSPKVLLSIQAIFTRDVITSPKSGLWPTMASKNDSTVKSDDKSSSGQLARGQLSSGENPRKSVEREPKPEADAADEPEWEDSNFVFDGERLRDRSSIVLKNVLGQIVSS